MNNVNKNTIGNTFEELAKAESIFKQKTERGYIKWKITIN